MQVLVGSKQEQKRKSNDYLNRMNWIWREAFATFTVALVSHFLIWIRQIDPEWSFCNASFFNTNTPANKIIIQSLRDLEMLKRVLQVFIDSYHDKIHVVSRKISLNLGTEIKISI